MVTMRYKREISDKIMHLSTQFPAIVVTGARQTGKTTLLRNLFPNYNYVSLDLPSDAQLAEEDPQSFLDRYPAPVLVDEVQYAPKLFRYLKVAIDRGSRSSGQFILTGSQKFTLMKEVSDSLAGRCALLDLETLSLHELGGAFFNQITKTDLASVLCRGLYPGLWDNLDIMPFDFYRSYLASYIERDVRQLLNISSLRDFDRFMRVCASRSGQLLNKSEIGKEVGVTSKTINDWLSVLEASNQIKLLEPYFSNVNKRLVKSPKLYFCDLGLTLFLLGINKNSLASSYLIGSLWETFVYSELRKYLFLMRPEASIWFYRDPTKEVDFLISYGSKFYFLDAKWKEFPNESDFSVINSVKCLFKNSAPESFVVCRSQNDFPIGKNMFALNGFSLHSFIDQRIC